MNAVQSANIIPAKAKLTSANDAQHFKKDFIFFEPNAIETIIKKNRIFKKMF